MRPGLGLETVRDAIRDWAAVHGAMIRMDRPLRHVPSGRHFHLAAPDLGTGTLEVNAVSDPATTEGFVEVVCREHWSGTWAGGAMLDLVQALATDLGPLRADPRQLGA